MDPSYNNGSFGSFGTAPQVNPMVGGGGDVVLTSSTPKKTEKKKWVILIITAIIVVLLLVVLGVLFAPTVMENVGANGALNKYGEYLSKYEEKGDSQYFVELKELYDKFLKEAENDEKYKDKMAELRKLPDFIDKVALIDQLESLSEEDILNKYVNDGYNGAQKFISGFFQYNGSDDKLFDYVIRKNYYYNVYLDVLKAYDENSCIVDGEINDACAKRAERSNSRLTNLISGSFEAKDECLDYVRVMRGSLLSSYDEIKEMVK